MLAKVLGLGPTIKYYKPERNCITIGVNDIFKYHYVKYLIIRDLPESFSNERLKIIEISTQSNQKNPN